jgi:hypothetical protein
MGEIKMKKMIITINTTNPAFQNYTSYETLRILRGVLQKFDQEPACLWDDCILQDSNGQETGSVKFK